MGEKISQICSTLAPQARIDLCVRVAEDSCGIQPPIPDTKTTYTIKPPGRSIFLVTDYTGCVNAVQAFVRAMPDSAFPAPPPVALPAQPPRPTPPPVPEPPRVIAPPAPPPPSVSFGPTSKVVEIGKAPGFVLPSIDGRVFRSEELRGKYVLLDFGSIVCTPCRSEWNDLQGLWTQNQGISNFTIVSITDNLVEDMKRYAQRTGLTYTILSDEDGEVLDQYARATGKSRRQTAGIPQTFILDPHGKIVWHLAGYGDRILQDKILPVLRKHGVTLKSAR